MKTTEFNKPITSKELKENIVKQFGANVNLEKYDREQLEDMRNKLRTRVFQQEGVKGFNDLLQNEAYQKDKAMLELLNTRIKEMLGEQMQKLRDRMDQLSEAKKGTRPPKTKISAKGSKPDFLDMDKDGDKKEPMKKAVDDKKAGPKKGVNPFAKKTESAMMPKGKKRPVKESFEGKLSFKEMVKLVQESGGQQQIDAVDKELFAWAKRVASTKFNEGAKAEVYAGLVYERMGGVFEMYDVLAETQK